MFYSFFSVCWRVFLDGFEGAGFFPLFSGVCAQPIIANNLCSLKRGDDAFGADEYCHQKLITIKISGEKSAKEKIVQVGGEKKHDCPTQWEPT